MTPTVPDQPDDWAEAGAYPVAPGVHRIPLPLPGDGLRAVNVYVIEDPDGLFLIDSGWAWHGSEQGLVDGLRDLGHAVADITRFFVTHAHHDHYTHALALRETFGAPVSIGRGERFTIEGAAAGVPPGQVDLLVRCGAASLTESVSGLLEMTRLADTAVWGPPDTWLDDGQSLDLQKRTLDIAATPGHTRGHIVLRDAAAGLLFAGDHVLPHITPSIGFERVPEPMPLRSYLQSLRLVRDMPDTLLLPAHGPVTASTHTRIDELLSHHEARLNDVLVEVTAGRATAYEVAQAMPWTRRARKFAELDPMNQALAVLEIGAHLDLLVEQSQVTVSEQEGVSVFGP